MSVCVCLCVSLCAGIICIVLNTLENKNILFLIIVKAYNQCNIVLYKTQ